MFKTQGQKEGQEEEERFQTNSLCVGTEEKCIAKKEDNKQQKAAEKS